MKEVELLLGRRWILKRQHPELYFKLRDQFSAYQEFFKDKLGYRLIVNPLLIKAEKIPGESQPWMGIQAFSQPMEYILLCLVLMFLEEKQPEEQFVLDQVTTFLQSHYPEDSLLDWTIFAHRRALIHVLRFCENESMILTNDGDDKSFEGNGTSAVLYENTGASKYFMRHFTFDVLLCHHYEEIAQNEWQGTDVERGIIRRHRVYRKLAMNPIVYTLGNDDPDYLYLKNQRSVLSYDFEKYLPVQLNIHRNGAMLLFAENALLDEGFPNRKSISDVTLHMCATLKKYQSQHSVKVDLDDSWSISETKWDQLLEQCILHYSHGWSKGHREDTGFSKLREELLQYMIEYGMLRRRAELKEIQILPAASKMIGHYPKEYLKKIKEMPEHINSVTEQLVEETTNIWEAMDESLED